MLERCGCRVLTAHDAPSALQVAVAEKGPIDLLVTDVVMPGQNGRQLHLQLQARRPGLPVLYMSGYAGDVIGQLGVLGDGAAFLQKPFNAEALAGALRTLLQPHPPKGPG
jgi:DNA-binding response OmpR family regulator